MINDVGIDELISRVATSNALRTERTSTGSANWRLYPGTMLVRITPDRA
jgi:hypothetical protein